MKYSLLFFVFFVGVNSVSASAQYYTNQNKVWAFGIQTGLDFNSGIPVAISTGLCAGMGMPEGCATVCDSSGHLLFYTNGTKVYNKTGAIMPLGASIVSFNTTSMEQAAVIMPVIGNPKQYYIFSLGSFSGLSNTHFLAYSKVDMTLNGGLGDVVTSSMGTQLQDSLGENMMAIAGNNNNIWLVTHRRDTSMFLAFNVTSAGVSPTPIRSQTGVFSGVDCYRWSMLRESPNRRRIAQGLLNVGHNQFYGTFMYDFDPSTGVVSNCRTIDTADNMVYGIEFSPDNSKLYSNGNVNIIQYDLSLPTLTAIQASRYVVTDSSDGADLRLGPDGRIYFRNGYSSNMDCIKEPNSSGATCKHIPDAATFTSAIAFETYPNLYVTTDTMNRVGVDEAEVFPHISLFPSPAATSLTVTSSERITNAIICNLMGQTVFSREFNSEKVQVDVSTLPTGVYFVRINGTEVRRFVKE